MKIFFLIGLMLTGLFVQSCQKASAEDLEGYVWKYRQVRVSRSMHQRLAPYQHLINYFSSLHYIKPGYRVDADFLAALVIAESAVDNLAQSNKDARGLTQILYSTGREAAWELAQTGFPFRFIDRNRLLNLMPDDLYDPAINLLIACYLIAKYNHQYQGRLELVVSAWNAGGGAIVNNTPPNFQETLDLIGKVNGYFIALRKQRWLSLSLTSKTPSS